MNLATMPAILSRRKKTKITPQNNQPLSYVRRSAHPSLCQSANAYDALQRPTIPNTRWRKSTAVNRGRCVVEGTTSLADVIDTCWLVILRRSLGLIGQDSSIGRESSRVKLSQRCIVKFVCCRERMRGKHLQ